MALIQFNLMDYLSQKALIQVIYRILISLFTLSARTDNCCKASKLRHPPQ